MFIEQRRTKSKLKEKLRVIHWNNVVLRVNQTRNIKMIYKTSTKNRFLHYARKNRLNLEHLDMICQGLRLWSEPQKVG